MATAQLLHIGQKPKTLKETSLFPNRVATEQQSMVLVKRLLAVSISCITYLRGLFPESSYGTCYLDDMCLKILREDKSCQGSLQIVKSHVGIIIWLEQPMMVRSLFVTVASYNRSCSLLFDLQHMTEFYRFKFKYSRNGPQMDFDSGDTQGNFTNGGNSEEIKQASILLIRKLYVLMQNLGPLPNDITLTMKLFYYNDGR
uniref:HORMA domain-containing protein n=1 Tax=Podarcis muralis TaxID=64176 RepID=A0A670KJD8_PODMU